MLSTLFYLQIHEDSSIGGLNSSIFPRHLLHLEEGVLGGDLRDLIVFVGPFKTRFYKGTVRANDRGSNLAYDEHAWE